MVKSLIISGSVNPAASTANTTQYWTIVGLTDRVNTEGPTQNRIYVTGVLSNFQISLSANSVNATTVFNLRKNGANGNQTVSVATNQTGHFEDATNTDSITSGDLIGIQSVPGSGSTGTFSMTYGCTVLTPTNSTVCVSPQAFTYPTGRNTLTGASTRYYQALNGFFDAANTTEATSQYKMQISGTFKNMTTYVLSNSRTTTTTAELRKGGASQTLTTSYTSTQTLEKVDTTHTVSVVDNDLVNFSILNGTGTSAISWDRLTAEFETTAASNLAQSLYIGYNQVIGTQARATTRYYAFVGYFDALTTEATAKFKMPVGGFTAKNLSVNITANGIASGSTFVLRVNGVDSALTIPITASTAGWYEDITHSVTINEGDDLDFALVSGTGSGSQTITMRGYAVHLEASGVRALTATISDSITLTGGSPVNLRGLIQTQSNSLTLSESIPRLRLLLQTNSDSVTIGAGSPVNLRGLIQTNSDSLSISDATSYTNRGKVRTFTQSLTLSESIPKITTRLRTIADSLTLTHTSTNRFRLLLQLFSDSLTFSDTRSRLSARIRTISESLALSESISRLKFINRIVSAESIGLSETNSRLVNKVRTLSGSVGFSHGLSRLTNRLRTITDIISLISDSPVRERMKTGLVNESLGLSESVNKLTTRLKTISQSLTLSETSLRLRGLLQTGSDSISFSEDIQKIRNKIRSTSDSLTLTSSIQTLRMKIRLLNQSLNLTDNLLYQTSRLRGFTQNLSLSDLVEWGGATYVKTIMETLDFTHGAQRTTSRLRTISDSIGLTDSISRIRIKLRTISHSVTLSETINQSKEFVKTISETLNFSHTNSKLTTRLRVISNSLSLSESTTNVKSRIRTIQQSLTLTSSTVQDALSSIIKTISEELTISDGAQIAKGKLKTITDTLSLSSDTVKSRLHRIKTISDTLNISDSSSRMRLFIMRSISQNLGLSSTVIRETKSTIKNFTIKIRRFKLFRYT